MQAEMQIFKKEVLRFPRLDTLLMVENKIRKAKGDFTIRQIWQSLPKKVMWQTFLTILDYLEYSGKIYVEKDKHILWIWNPKAVEELKKKGLIIK